MDELEHQHRNRSIHCALVVLGVVGAVVAGLAVVIAIATKQADENFQRQMAEWRQESFDRVKRGNPTATVMDSKLLPMLANDPDCRRNVTRLDFAMTTIDPADAQSVSQLNNVTSMTFYCTTGTRDLLLAARSLPITDLYFEGDDLPVDAYLMLKDFPHLREVRIERVLDGQWIERMRTEMPDVAVNAPFPRSQEP